MNILMLIINKRKILSLTNAAKKWEVLTKYVPGKKLRNISRT